MHAESTYSLFAFYAAILLHSAIVHNVFFSLSLTTVDKSEICLLHLDIFNNYYWLISSIFFLNTLSSVLKFFSIFSLQFYILSFTHTFSLFYCNFYSRSLTLFSYWINLLKTMAKASPYIPILFATLLVLFV